MNIFKFPECNLEIPKGQDNQKTLHALHDPKEGSIIFGFTMNQKERKQFMKTGKVYLKIITLNRTMPPVVISVNKEELIKDKHMIINQPPEPIKEHQANRLKKLD